MERMYAWRRYAGKIPQRAVTLLTQDDSSVLAMVATANSTVRMHHNLVELAEGDVSGMPSWTQVLVMHIPDVSMDSFQQLHGLRESAPTLEQYLDKKMDNHWRWHYFRVRDQYFDNLWDIISVELRIPEWLEITAGYSLEGYRSLDVQVKGLGGMRHFEEWCLINSAEAESERIVPEPAAWVNCRHLSASGWRPPYADFSYHEVLRAKSRL